MQKIYDLIYQLSRTVKNRFGYAVTIQQAKFAAYAAFLVSMFAAFSAAIHAIYQYLGQLNSVFVDQTMLFFPSANVVAGVATMYVSALITRKVWDYMHNAWKAWAGQNSY